MATLCLCVAMFSEGRYLVTQQGDQATPGFFILACRLIRHSDFVIRYFPVIFALTRPGDCVTLFSITTVSA
jgi:hypothetical protein